MDENLRKTLLQFIREKAYNPLNAKELAFIFDIHKSEFPMFLNMLEEMEEEGLLFKTKKKKYGPPVKMNMEVGKLTVHQKGFGFVLPDDADQEDVFIPPSSMQDAMHGDRVVARITKVSEDGKKREGEIIKVLERSITQVVGTYESGKGFGFVVPDNKKMNKDIYIPRRLTNGAKTGSKVVCEITVWPKKGRNPEGKVKEIIGRQGDPGVDIVSIIKDKGIRQEFPTKVLLEADSIEDSIPESEIKNRLDLRGKTIFTIDGADAKDLDDAVSIEKLENGNYSLGVHIADVTHYVTENSKLDKEAFKRATSVYLTDRVIPMLPKNLSNGVCSLHPNVDRLTLSVFMEIDPSGKVVNHQIKKTVINSVERLIYTDISDILEKSDEELSNKYAHIMKELKMMENLAKALTKKREARGAIDFDFPEAKIVLDDKGFPVDIYKYDRRIANRIIEEFMLICNETVAEHFFWLEAPFVYRVHENPSAEKIEEFNKFLAAFGYRIKGDLSEVHPNALKELLDQVKGKKEELVVSTLMLRSLKQAKYSPACDGHFGLAAKYYSHFTSPIRRYPDLQIHRIMKEYLDGKVNAERLKKLKAAVEATSNQSSDQERVAEDAERQVDSLKKAEYMSKRIGNIYDGVISGVTSFGIFVELDNTIEGRIHLSTLSDDYYIFDSEKYILVGEHTRNIFRIGDPVKVKVESVSIPLKEIEFSMVNE